MDNFPADLWFWAAYVQVFLRVQSINEKLYLHRKHMDGNVLRVHVRAWTGGVSAMSALKSQFI